MSVLIAFGLTLFAGLATGIGSIIALVAKRTNCRFLSISTGFSAGVMLYVAFVEIFVKGREALAERYGDATGNWLNAGAFFFGMLVIGLIDNLIPAAQNPHETYSEAEIEPLHQRGTERPANPCGEAAPPSAAGHGLALGAHHGRQDHKLMRMGLFTALAIAIHNLPEGLATFLSALKDPELGIAIAVAVALHNIPEGISVSVPIFYATGSRRKAFVYSFLSGLAEPFGALVAYFALRLFIGGDNGFPPQVMGLMFAIVAGIMVYISLDELLPTSRAYGRGHDSLLGLIAGMVVMSLSLLLIQ